MAWRPEYILLIILSTIIDYYCGLKMGSLKSRKERKPFLYLSLLSNLGILFSFKYLDFFTESINSFLGLSIPMAELILPMGISFYTFQTMSYSIDVYKGDLEPERHFGKFALFVTFFPQLVAGPIERASNLLPQFHKEIKFDYDRIVSGLRLMLWGFFKKVVIADRLALFVNEVYNHPTNYQGAVLLIATIFFAFQIYCDFSGYSDIAIGSARILGFDLMKNFDTPYLSKNISEFWKRWHISLSTWFKDYVYIPLGGNRTVKWRWYYNLLITFFISGLWHGANWTYVIWGALHGFYLVFAIVSKPYREKIHEAIGLNAFPKLKASIEMLVTFGLVCFAWIFFRANSVGDALYFIKGIFTFNDYSITHFSPYVFDMSTDVYSMDIGLAWFGIITLLSLEQNYSRFDFLKNYIILRWGVYFFAIISIIILGAHEKNEFIYFQF